MSGDMDDNSKPVSSLVKSIPLVSDCFRLLLGPGLIISFKLFMLKHFDNSSNILADLIRENRSPSVDNDDGQFYSVPIQVDHSYIEPNNR
ncbi:hypothetical protein DERF_005830 [Dermatophagoides farinae]|uniref:Uncharacterized protein n=1 Tax=Dermatophagoides farinae TaxID=6954 RepID=A0A922I928_DERFA|nr:hypothetical protein DERF_005830 [Dermatophagoides farinae]